MQVLRVPLGSRRFSFLVFFLQSSAVIFSSFTPSDFYPVSPPVSYGRKTGGRVGIEQKEKNCQSTDKSVVQGLWDCSQEQDFPGGFACDKLFGPS